MKHLAITIAFCYGLGMDAAGHIGYACLFGLMILQLVKALLVNHPINRN